MSVLTFRGVCYEQGSLNSNSDACVKQLVYRSALKDQHVIRSAPTAALLQLDDPKRINQFVYRGIPVRPLTAQKLDRAPLQQGGVIRSRMTAELLGINPVKAVGEPVRHGGIVRSRAMANLLQLDCTKHKSPRIYRGIAYQDSLLA